MMTFQFKAFRLSYKHINKEDSSTDIPPIRLSYNHEITFTSACREALAYQINKSNSES